MKEMKFEVKSQGKVVDTVMVKQFDTVAEAQKTLTDVVVLDLINSMYKTRVMNEARAAKTRTSSPQAAIARAVKNNPQLMEKIMAMLGEDTPAPAPAPEAKKA